MIQERIRKVIEDSKLSLSKFAQQVGVAKNTLINYRDGVSSPTVEFVTKTCEAFNANPTWLLTGEGDPYIPARISQYGIRAEDSPEGGVKIGVYSNGLDTGWLSFVIWEYFNHAGGGLTKDRIERSMKFLLDMFRMFDVSEIKVLVKVIESYIIQVENNYKEEDDHSKSDSIDGKNV